MSHPWYRPIAPPRPFASFGRDLYIAGIILAGTVGCQSQSAMYPVRGKVTVDGAPMAAGSVTLHPDGARGNSSLEISGGKVRDGQYEIRTGPRQGAPPGAYRVVVISTNFSGDNPPPKGPTAEMPRSLIDTQFSDPGRTPLAFEVVERPAPGAYDLQVTAPKGK